MKLYVILTPCAFTDTGKQWKGGIYQADKYIVSAHRGAIPRFNRRKIIRYDKLGVGLLPYGHDGQSHFWVGTAPFVCTLLKVLPQEVKVLVVLNKKTTPLFKVSGLQV
jgi:hypothetical protein